MKVIDQSVPSNSTVAVIGECMLELGLTAELSATVSTSAEFGFGGDTLNMSVYLARLGSKVEYISALGDESLSDWMIGRWQAEGVGCKHVFRHKSEVPGMYMIELDDVGERSFKYWRANSPAAKIIDDEEQAAAVFEAISNYKTLFISGISLAILQPLAREKMIAFLARYRKAGGRVVFDCNHRPNLWQSPQHASKCYEKVYQQTDIALPTFDDEQALFNYDSPEHALQSIHDLGVKEIVLKLGEKGCMYSRDGQQGLVAVEPVKVVDTTSAGDSFNAGYLHSRLSGAEIEQACNNAHALASTVIQHRGAIIPREAMSN